MVTEILFGLNTLDKNVSNQVTKGHKSLVCASIFLQQEHESNPFYPKVNNIKVDNKVGLTGIAHSIFHFIISSKIT